jgi:hypothetical protein
MKDETLIAEDEMTFDQLTECDTLVFTPPLKIEWGAWKSNDGDDCGNIRVFVDYDFGLTDKFSPYKSIGKGWCYNDITKDTPLPEIVKAFVQYDLFHAFCHTPIDPNYSHLHWALYGNLKDRVKVIEAPIDFS